MGTAPLVYGDAIASVAVGKGAPSANAFELKQQGKPIIVICPGGRLFWNEREVESDEDFRAAMLEMVAIMKASMGLR